MQENSSELTPKQERVIELLVSGKSITAAAKEGAVNQSTIQRWQKDPLFQSRYREAKRRVFDERLDALESSVFMALVKHIKADVPPSAGTQMAAMRIWNEMRQQGQAMTELEKEFEIWRMDAKENKEEWGA